MDGFGRRLGKRPARHGAVKLQFADFFDATKLPTPPAAFGHYGAVDAFHALGNDRYSNCVLASAAHETMIWSLEGGRSRARFTTEDVLQDYAAVTGFDRTRPETDAGTDMQAAASYRRKTGIRDTRNIRHTVDSYMALRVGNVEQVVLAMYLLGAVSVGLQLPVTAEPAFDARQPWTVDDAAEIAGGHCVTGCGRRANGNLVAVTWGGIQEMTPEFYHRYNDEGVAYVSLEVLNDSGLSPDGFDAAGLRQQLSILSGGQNETS